MKRKFALYIFMATCLSGCNAIPMSWKSAVVRSSDGSEQPASADQEKLPRYDCSDSAQCIQVANSIFSNYDPVLSNGILVCPTSRMVCIYTQPPIAFQIMEIKQWVAESTSGVAELEKELSDNTYTGNYDKIETEHTLVTVSGNEVLVVYKDESRPKLNGQGIEYVPMVNRLPGDQNYDFRDYHFQCVDNGLPGEVTPDDCETQDAYNEQIQIIQEAKQNQLEEQKEEEQAKQAERQAELESQPGYQMLQLFGAMANLKAQQDTQSQQTQQQQPQQPPPSSSN